MFFSRYWYYPAAPFVDSQLGQALTPQGNTWRYGPVTSGLCQPGYGTAVRLICCNRWSQRTQARPPPMRLRLTSPLSRCQLSRLVLAPSLPGRLQLLRHLLRLMRPLLLLLLLLLLWIHT